MKRSLIFCTVLMISNFAMAASKEIDIKQYSVTPCNVVLSQNSTDWVKTYTKAYNDSTLEKVKAIYQYGVCYDQKLASLQEQLNKKNRGPMMGASGNFRDFEAARKAFVEKALAVCGMDGTYKRILRANAELYGKQFQYYFLQQYLSKSDLPKVNVAAQNKAKQKVNDIIKEMESTGQDCKQIKATFAEYVKEGVDANQLPAEQIYNYAIMLLQPSSEPAYSPRPF